MTAREIDMLKEFLSREMHDLKEELVKMRQEAAVDHESVKRGLEKLSARVEVLEDHETIDQSRREFRNSIVKVVVAANAAAAALGTTVALLIDNL